MTYRNIDPERLYALATAAVGTSLSVGQIGTEIQTQIDKASDRVSGAPSASTRAGDAAEALATLGGFAEEHALVYVEDVKPLRELTEAGYWLPDFTTGWSAEDTLAENIDRLVRSDEFDSFVLGTAGSLLEYYRRWDLHVTRPGSGPAMARLGDLARNPPLPQGYVPAAPQGGTAMVRSPSGLLVPEATARSMVGDANAARFNQLADPHVERRSTRGLSPDPSRGRPPAWARNAGRGLGAVGVGLTVYDSAASQWQQDQYYHPDMGTGQRVARVGYNVATEGGGAVAGGIAGAKIGAALGTVGGPVGMVAGGIVGGAIGSFIGSKAGKAAGRAAKEVGKGIAKGAKKVWNSLFG